MEPGQWVGEPSGESILADVQSLIDALSGPQVPSNTFTRRTCGVAGLCASSCRACVAVSIPPCLAAHGLAWIPNRKTSK